MFNQYSSIRELRAMLYARARWQRQRMAEMAAPGALQQQYGCGSGLDALTERFLRETHALDRDTEHLDARLRGRRQKKQRFPGKRGHKQNGGRGDRRTFGGSTIGGGGNDSNNRSCSFQSSNICSDPAWRGSNRNSDATTSSSSVFLASVNSNERAPFLLLATAEEVGGGGAASSTSSPAAAASLEAGGGGAGGVDGSCRVQSYFTQALGGESLCGAANRRRQR